ncbi:MAG: asparagine synthase (glutamine-hydrolyzing) [Chlamydiia bacterium]|nr:asparagine synthase (glutamine-hydrolyzing) [Chlamydiia bacterium]
MCGISALFSRKARPLLDAMKEMNTLIRHRGPDDEGYAFFQDLSTPAVCAGGIDTPASSFESHLPYAPKRHAVETPARVALGHRRLSIVDLSAAGHQPMCCPEGRYWMTYNGEVYNHIELRRELEVAGAVFQSHTDSEVILQAYARWGESCLHRFNGMFSFVIYDRITGKIFAARDRFGIKPLYYWISPDGILAIASEIKQFTALPGWQARLHGQCAFDFLNWSLTAHRSETHFEGVQQLRGGHCLHTRINDIPKVRIQQWYHLPTQRFEGSYEDAVDAFRTLLRDSVRLRLRADVPVGSCLSGGLDSSSIVCLMNEQLKAAQQNRLQNTFSACSTHSRFDESSYMRAVVDHTGVIAHYIYPSLSNLFDRLDTIIWHQDEPFGSTSIFAQWEVFQLARQEGVKVMLDGQGADEQLGGYAGFLGVYLYDLLRRGRLDRVLHECRAYKDKHGIARPSRLLLRHLVPARARFMARRLLGLPRGNTDWLALPLLGDILNDPHQGSEPRLGAVNQLCYAQLTRTNLPMLLAYEDRDSMAHSIEARTPFIDYRLVELVQSLPADYKLRDGMTKRVMRSSMEGILPESVRQRVDKLGFATPEEVWVQKEQPELFKREVRRSIELAKGILTPKALDLADAVIDGRRPFDFVLWRMIVFGRWMKRFNVQLPR